MKAKTILNGALACALLFAFAGGASAEPRGRHERGWHGDMRGFHEHDFGRWRGGRWHEGYHGGHFGWWWIVGGVWYWYPRPVYPYPDPYVPPVYIERPAVVAPAPAAPPAPTAAPPQSSAPGTWYYCDSAKSYYPYVADCPGGWRPVPATPNPPTR